MTEEDSSYYSEDSERNITSEEDEWEYEDELDDEYSEVTGNKETREVYGLTVIGEKILDKIESGNAESGNILGGDLGFNIDGSDGETSWIRVLIDNSIQIDHVTVINKIIDKVFNENLTSKLDEMEFPLKIKIKDKTTKKEEILMLDFKHPRGDEILLADIPSESKHVVNSLISHLHIYRYNNNNIKFINYHNDSEVDGKFGFKSWHKYKHV
ncbi:hypothetical protein FG379_000612 [Cryptosporidium bovis]|uniref:uncharacterized protein n=1 Tax=Cryptosporidium bovis TaxID=310047 RepID=UPI003519F471|nr:hypothetical protein FG379_000612 [Cryptosporidium bovis]